MSLTPHWGGPYEEGISTSSLSNFLTCRHRFYIKKIVGLREPDGDTSSLDFGSLWHIMEEEYAKSKSFKKARKQLLRYVRKQTGDTQRTLARPMKLVLCQFPHYITKWENNWDAKSLLQEEEFNIEYTLPSQRKVKLIGIIDEVVKMGGIYIKENKTKGRIDEEGIAQTLHYNLQTGIYHVALKALLTGLKENGIISDSDKVEGTIYNIIRRPLTPGNKHSIRQKKGEGEKEFYGRLSKLIEETPDYYFLRYRTIIKPSTVNKFKTQILNPILEQLCDWWEWIIEDPENPYRKGNTLHYQFPFGVYNSLSGGFRGDYFQYLTTGRKDNLRNVNKKNLS